jgi:hypothetical protein
MFDHVPEQQVTELQDWQLQANRVPEFHGSRRAFDSLLGWPARLEVASDHPERVLTKDGGVGEAS